MVDAQKAKAAKKRKRAERPPGEEIQRGKYVYLDPRKSLFWQMEFDLYGTTHRKTTECRDRRKAERFAREYRDARIDEHVRIYGKRGVPDRVRDGRLDEAIDVFWAREAHKDAGAGDTKTRFMTLVEILRAETRLSEIDDERVWRLIRTLEERGLSDDRVDTHVKTLRRLMNDAVAVRKFHLPDMPNWPTLTLADVARTRELSLDEVDAAFDAWRADTTPAARFLHESGLRLTNAVELRWAQVDLELMMVTVKVKAPKSRRRKRRQLDERRIVQELPITPAMHEILLGEIGKHPTSVFTFRCQRTMRGRCGTLFVKGRFYPLKVPAFRKHWAATRDGVGLVDARPHDFRRTRGSLVLRATGDITKAQKVLHHSRVGTTAHHYARVAPAETLAAMVQASAFEAAQRARRPRRPVPEAGALQAPVVGNPEELPDSPSAKGVTHWHATETSSPSATPSLSWASPNDNLCGAKVLTTTNCEETGFRSSDPATALVLADCQFQANGPKPTVHEANSRTFPGLPGALGDVDAGALEAGSVVIHQGVRGRFREVRRKVACRLDEAFEPTPMERLRKAGHTFWAFEPEDGSVSDQVVVVGERHQVAVRGGAG